MAPQKSKKDRSMLLALLLFVGAAMLIFAYLGEGGNKIAGGAPAAVKTEKFEKAVNKHLMFTNESIELQKQKMKIENSRWMTSSFSSTKPQTAYTNSEGLDQSQDTRAQEMANELGRGKRNEEITSPHDVIQRDLFNEQQMQEYSQAYREEYARQFIENARRGGYKVILSEDLSHVISVTPIKKPANYNVDPSGTGSEFLQ